MGLFILALRNICDRTGIPLCVSKEQAWENVVIPISSGDCLVLYTDGITEARSKNGEQFGLERLLGLIQQSVNDPDVMLQNIVDTLTAYQQGMGPSDDQTLLIVQPDESNSHKSQFVT